MTPGDLNGCGEAVSSPLTPSNLCQCSEEAWEWGLRARTGRNKVGFTITAQEMEGKGWAGKYILFTADCTRGARPGLPQGNAGCSGPSQHQNLHVAGNQVSASPPGLSFHITQRGSGPGPGQIFLAGENLSSAQLGSFFKWPHKYDSTLVKPSQCFSLVSFAVGSLAPLRSSQTHFAPHGVKPHAPPEPFFSPSPATHAHPPLHARESSTRQR